METGNTPSPVEGRAEEREAAPIDAICEECGRKNICWHAESEIWNRYSGYAQVLCPICFVNLVEAQGATKCSWLLVPECDLEATKDGKTIGSVLAQEDADIREALDDLLGLAERNWISKSAKYPAVLRARALLAARAPKERT